MKYSILIHPKVAKKINAVRRWIKKIEERLPISTEKNKRNLKMK